jgi:hypothetical protein
LGLAVRRQANAGTIGANRVGDGLRRLTQQPDAIDDGAAIRVVAKVTAVAQELIDQVAVEA